MNDCWGKMYDEFFSIPLTEHGGDGWKELSLKLSITLEDNSSVNNIVCWRYRDDMITMIDGERYKLPTFISYKFE